VKELSPKQSFLLLYISTPAFVVTVFLLAAYDVGRTVFGLPWFAWPFLIIIATFFISVAVPRVRSALRRLEIPQKYSPKHFLLLLWLTAQAFLLGIVLHNALYALFWHFVCGLLWGKVCAGDEPVFFIIALCLVPAGFIVGAIGRVWEGAVVGPIEKMKAKGIQLPGDWRYFAPIGCYIWLWRFGKGIEAITEGRMGARRVFAAVFLLGVIGFVIVHAIIQRRLIKAGA
jgi:hypothetical protein